MEGPVKQTDLSAFFFVKSDAYSISLSLPNYEVMGDINKLVPVVKAVAVSNTDTCLAHINILAMVFYTVSMYQIHSEGSGLT